MDIALLIPLGTAVASIASVIVATSISQKATQRELREFKLEMREFKAETADRFEALESKMDAKIDALESKMNARIDALEFKIEALDNKVTRNTHAIIKLQTIMRERMPRRPLVRRELEEA